MAESPNNDRFAAYTRSASFALTLSSAQIDYLLGLIKIEELAAKYPWYRPAEVNFGKADDIALEWSNSTVQALARRGLVDVVPTPPPVCRHEVIRPSRAGRLLAELLSEAGFAVDPRHLQPVPCHPDDRIPLRVTANGFTADPTPPDRRAPADPDDLPYLSGYRAIVRTAASTGAGS